MNIKTSFAALAIFTAFSANAYQHYSVFEDYVDLNTVQANTSRLTQILKTDNNQTTIASSYSYDGLGRVTQRDYADSTFDYIYNSDGWLESAKALMKQGEINSYVRHTKQNFISLYTYNEQGQVTLETKKVFHQDAANLIGTPIATYSIEYVYNENNKLTQRVQTPLSGDDMSVTNFHYTYHDDGKLRKIREVKMSSPREKSTLLLRYHPNGEIKKVTQKIFSQGKKTIEMTYLDDASIYGVYYVDPVKEWKVDMDFFGLAFKPIKTLKQTVDNIETTYTYQYQNNDNDNLPDSLELNVSIPQLKVNKQVRYEMKNQ